MADLTFSLVLPDKAAVPREEGTGWWQGMPVAAHNGFSGRVARFFTISSISSIYYLLFLLFFSQADSL